jgi:plastocyanin
MRRAASLPLALVLLLIPAVPGAAADGFMSVQDLQFAPRSVQVLPGERVAFNFEGPSTHSATLRAGQTDRYDTGLTGPGFTKMHRFEYPGLFALYCRSHAQMNATVQAGTPETLAPRLTKLKAKAGVRRVKLSFRLSERSVVSVAVGGRRVRRVRAAGRRSIRIGNLARGRRTAKIKAKDGWGNRSPATKRSFTVRSR